MKIRLLPALSMLAILIFTGCRSMRAPEFRYIENLRVDNIGLNQACLGMDLRYRNPNRGKLILKNAEGDAWLDNNYLGHFKLDTMVRIPSEEEFSLPVSLQLETDQLIRNSMALLGNKEVTIRLAGRARVGRSGLFINYPLRYEGKQTVKRLIR